MNRRPPRSTLFPYPTLFRSLRAQITTSASPMSLAPRRVRRSGAPGPAPINQTLPKLPPLFREGDRREVRRLPPRRLGGVEHLDRKSTRLNSSHANISYAVFC